VKCFVFFNSLNELVVMMLELMYLHIIYCTNITINDKNHTWYLCKFVLGSLNDQPANKSCDYTHLSIPLARLIKISVRSVLSLFK